MENNFDWFRVDNLKPELRYGYPSSIDDSNTYINIDTSRASFTNLEKQLLEVFESLWRILCEQDYDDNKIVIGYRRLDNNELVFVAWKDSFRKIGKAAYNRDNAEPSRPWN